MAPIDSDSVTQLMHTLDVFINIRHKPKQSTMSVIIKGIERNAGNIYEARKQLLGLDEPRVMADIPYTYQIPPSVNSYANSTNSSLNASLNSSLNSSLSSNNNNPSIISE